MCVASLHIFFMIASTRINAVFFAIFLFAGLGFFLFAGALWRSAEAAANASDLMVVSTLYTPNNCPGFSRAELSHLPHV